VSAVPSISLSLSLSLSQHLAAIIFGRHTVTQTANTSQEEREEREGDSLFLQKDKSQVSSVNS